MWTSTDQVLVTSWSACSRAVSAEPIFTSSTANYQEPTHPDYSRPRDRRSRRTRGRSGHDVRAW